PGPEQSAALIYDTDAGMPVWWVKADNDEVRNVVSSHARLGAGAALAVENIASYGMPVGAETFGTCIWIGRFIERWRIAAVHIAPPARLDPILVYRREVKLHLCGSARAKDPNVRQALIDRFGPGKDRAIGLKASPGPLYGLSGDGWAALGVAVTVADGAAQAVAA
ncbi:MAG: hypothetical protein ACRDNS_12285, partial [Trebonia sp.]